MRKDFVKISKTNNDRFKPDKNWMVNRYWVQKGQPKNLGQIKISGSHNIELLAWRQPTQDKIEELYYCVSLLHTKLILPTSYILFDNVDMYNPYDPTIKCTGYRRRSERVIQFYPYAYTTAINHQGIDGVPIWLGAIIHEFAHNQDFYPNIIKAWIQKFGWTKLARKRVVLAGDGSYTEIEHKCTQPNKLITHYASFKPSEDFSESMVAYFFCPDRLDIEKLAFIQRCFDN